MASLRKVLLKAGYLNTTALNLQKFIDKQNQRSNQTKFNELMQTAFDEMMRSGTEEGESTFVSGTDSRMNDFLPPDRGSLPPGDPADPELAQQLIKEKGLRPPGTQPPDIHIEDPPDEILGDLRKRTPDEQRMNIQQSQFNALFKASQIPDLDPSKFTQAQQLLGLFGKSVTPGKVQKVQKEYKSVAIGSDLIEISDDGSIKIVRPGSVQAKTEKSIGSYTDKDGKNRITLYDPETQTTREIISDKTVRPPRGLKIEFPKPEKWRNFGSVINGIYYKTDEDGNILETTPQEQKILRDLAQNKVLGNILPGAIDFLKKDIWDAWNRENMSQEDFEEEISQGLNAGEISPEEAQDLLDYNAFRPFLYDVLIETVERNPEE